MQNTHELQEQWIASWARDTVNTQYEEAVMEKSYKNEWTALLRGSGCNGCNRQLNIVSVSGVQCSTDWGICGGSVKQTVRESGCVVGLMLDSRPGGSSGGGGDWGLNYILDNSTFSLWLSPSMCYIQCRAIYGLSKPQSLYYCFITMLGSFSNFGGKCCM